MGMAIHLGTRPNAPIHGTLPEEQETACYANEKPYLYGVKNKGAAVAADVYRNPVEVWREHLLELALWHPRLLPRS